MKKHLTRDDFQHIGSLITYQADDKQYCLGYLIDFKGHGVFEPNLGKVDITPEEADIHNACLDTAMLEGLDKNCEVGMGGTFYLLDGKVKTFTGKIVSEDVAITGKHIVFIRGGMTFKGTLQKDADCFNFRRTD